MADAIALAVVGKLFVWADTENNIFLWRPPWENFRLVEKADSPVKTMRSGTGRAGFNQVVITYQSHLLLLTFKFGRNFMRSLRMNGPFGKEFVICDERIVDRQGCSYIFAVAFGPQHVIRTAFTSIRDDDGHEVDESMYEAKWQLVSARSNLIAEAILDIGPNGFVLLRIDGGLSILDGFDGRAFGFPGCHLPHSKQVASMPGTVALIEWANPGSVNVCRSSQQEALTDGVVRTRASDWLSLYTRLCGPEGYRSEITKQRIVSGGIDETTSTAVWKRGVTLKTPSRAF
jgi:hypothetical protein